MGPKLVLVVPGAPPTRSDPGRCADRASPNAEPLARACRALIDADPSLYPVDWTFGMTAAFGTELGDTNGYGPDDPIIEVMVDSGVLTDERQERTWRELRRSSIGRYVVIIEPTDGHQGSGSRPMVMASEGHVGPTVIFVVPAPPPVRADPGRSADRRSPHAEPLAHAGASLVATDPAAFPLQWQGVVVAFGRTLPDVEEDGYQPTHPIIEVLADAGAVIDPEGWWDRQSRHADQDYYVVTFRSDDGP